MLYLGDHNSVMKTTLGVSYSSSFLAKVGHLLGEELDSLSLVAKFAVLSVTPCEKRRVLPGRFNDGDIVEGTGTHRQHLDILKCFDQLW